MKHRISNWGVKVLAYLLIFCLLLSPVFPCLTAQAADIGAEEAPAKTVAAEAAQEGVQTESVTFTQIDGSAVTADLTSGQEAELSENATDVEAPYADDEEVRVFIVMEKKPVIEAGFSTKGLADNQSAMTYREDLLATQTVVAERISDQVLDGEALSVSWNLTIAMNAIAATVEFGQIEDIMAVDGVAAVYLDRIYTLPDEEPAEETLQPMTAASNGMIGSYAAWETGYTGAGRRIAIIDTGIDTDHNSFNADAFLYSLEETAKEAGKTVEDYDLLDQAGIDEVLPRLNAGYSFNEYTGVTERFTAEDLYYNEKIAFGFDYILFDPNIEHDRDSDHGSHVSGIAAANRYVPAADGTYTAQENGVVGAAPDAQLLVMKVFYAGMTTDSVYMAAIEDALLLGADSINMSLGSTQAGFVYSGAAYIDQIFENLVNSDTIVAIAAGNNYTWATYSASETGLLYADDAGEYTTSSPATYDNALSVASVNNAARTGVAIRFEDTLDVAYTETIGYGNDAFVSLDTSGEGTKYDYVLLNGLGEESDYNGLDVMGKIVLVSRGVTSFSEKVNIAASNGAVGVIVYNNEVGTVNMNLTGIETGTPAVSITQADAEAIRAVSTEENGVYTGTLLVSSEIKTVEDSLGYTMSDFSSWGPTGGLTIKPEITAPGGNVFSVRDENTYGTMSGTSMAAPGVTGAAALVAQYIEENGLNSQTGLTVRALAQSLLMATADPLIDPASGVPYPVRQQGAGLVNAYDAVTSNAYVLVGEKDGNDGKAKIELGDDPDRTGVYSFQYTLYNLTTEDQTYILDALVMTPDVVAENGVAYQSTSDRLLAPNVSFEAAGTTFYYDVNGDGTISRLDAQELLNYVAGKSSLALEENRYDLNRDGALSTADVRLYLDLLAGMTVEGVNLRQKAVLLPANGSVTVNGTISLSSADREFLETNFVNGSYIEGYIQAKSSGSADLSIPLLAFYGNWTDPSMFERVQWTPEGFQSDVPAPYVIDETNFFAVGIDKSETGYYYPQSLFCAVENYSDEYNFISTALNLQGFYFTLLRNAAYINISVTDADSGAVYYDDYNSGDVYTVYGAYYYTMWNNLLWLDYMDWSCTDLNGKLLPDGTKVNVTLTALPEYYLNGDRTLDESKTPGKGASLGFTATIDNTAPCAEDIQLITDVINGDRKLEVTASDNYYVADVSLFNASGFRLLQDASLSNPEQGTIAVTLDLSEYNQATFVLRVRDFAGNATFYRLKLGSDGSEDLLSDGAIYTLYGGNYVTSENEWSYFYPNVVDAGGYIKRNESIATLPCTDLQYFAGAYYDGYVYVVGDGYLSAIDAVTFEQTVIKPFPLVGREVWPWVAMACNYVTEEMYLIYNNSLYQVDLLSGDATLVHAFTASEMPCRLCAMTFTDTGALLLAGCPDVGSSLNIYQFTLQDGKLTDGQKIVVSATDPIPFSYRCSMTYDWYTGLVYFTADRAESLYTSHADVLYTLNTQTFECTKVGCFNNMVMGVGDPWCKFLYCIPRTDSAPSDAPTQVTLSDEQLAMTIGQKRQLSAYVTPWKLSDRSVIWTSSDEAVATVDSTGLVTCTGEGRCVITATSVHDPAVSASCTIIGTPVTLEAMAFVHGTDGSTYWADYSLTYGVTKLADSELDVVSATMIDDTIYALTSEGDVYTVDSRTFEETLLGNYKYAYHLLQIAGSQTGNIIGVDYQTNSAGIMTNSYRAYLMDKNMNNISYMDFEDYLWYLPQSVPAPMVGLTYIKNVDNYSYWLEIDASGVVYTFTIDETRTGYMAGMNSSTDRSADLSNPAYTHSFKTTNIYGNAMYYDPINNRTFIAFSASEDSLAHMEVFEGSRFSADTYTDFGVIDKNVQYFTALFNPTPYTVTYKSERGTQIPAETVYYGNHPTKPEDPVQEGWDFVGWYTDESNTELYDFSTPVTEDITLYAKWTLAEGYCLVTFESNGGTAIESVVVQQGSAILRPVDPKRSGYNFVEWCTDEDLKQVWDFSQLITESMTLYAKWQICTYTVSFDSNGGTEITAQVVEHGSTVTEPTAPSKEGYSFDGWYTNSELSTAYDFSKAVTADLILYARWHETSLTEVYLDGVSGSDENDGSRYYPVKTFEKAKSLLADARTNTIQILNQVTITENKTWDLSGYEDAVVKTSCTYYPIQVSSGGSLTLTNITLDGDNVCNYFFYVYGGSLTVNQGTVIQNCKTYAFRLYPNNSTSVTLNGGAVQNNGTGALYGYAMSNAAPSLVLSPAASTELTISGNLNLRSVSLSSLLPLKLTIASSLDNLTLPDGALYLTGYLADGHVVAVPGENYTITQSDLDKLKLRDETLTLVLEDGNVVVRTASQGD